MFLGRRGGVSTVRSGGLGRGWGAGGGGGGGGGQEPVERGPVLLPGPVGGQVQAQPPGGGRGPGRDVDERAPDRRGGRLGQRRGLGQGAGGAGEVEGHHGAEQPGRVGGEDARGQVGQG